MEEIKGRLLDIGSHGARLLLYDSITVGSHIVLELQLPSPSRGFTRMRFEGTVLRSEPQHEIAVSFPESGKFLRTAFEGPDVQSEGHLADENEE